MVVQRPSVWAVNPININLIDMTEQQLKGLGFELTKQYEHDEFHIMERETHSSPIGVCGR